MLRTALLQLAHQHPKLRRHLVPLLRKYAESFDEAVKNKKFKNPETGNEVQFSSLPAKEQEKIRKDWNSKQDGDKKKAPEKRPAHQVLEDGHSMMSSIGERQVIGIIERLAPEGKDWSDLSREERNKILDKPISERDGHGVNGMYNDYNRARAKVHKHWDEDNAPMKDLPARSSIKTYEDLYKIRDHVNAVGRHLQDMDARESEDED